MSGNGHRQIDIAEGFERDMNISARRVNRGNVVPQRSSRWLPVIGIVTTVASMTVLLIGQEPSVMNYLATFALLGSIGILAFISTSRSLNVGARYEESVSHVEEIARSYHSLRQVVTAAMDVRDQVTGGHSDRVAEMSLLLGRRLGLTEDRLHYLEWAAFLHDIGKVRIDANILTKPGPLDANEWAEMQRHPYFSYSILLKANHLRDAAEIAYCHHERYDGMGYPRRLRGTEIPLEARIFSVADAYDAMVSQRPYRQSLDHDVAVREIISHAGSQFDPQVVVVFAQWALSVSGDSTRRIVEEELERLPVDLPRLRRAS